MLYTDGVYLVAGNVRELHIFAQTMGVDIERYKENSIFPHYTLTKKLARKVIKLGVKKVSTIELMSQYK